MALSNDIDLLSRLPLFSGMSQDQLRLIAFGADRRSLAAGQMLFREASPAESAYVVIDGRIRLLVTDRGGEMREAGFAEPGTMLSELALVTLVERKFTAVTETEATVLRITRSLFHRLIQEYPDAAALIEARIRDNIAALAARASEELHRFS